MTGLEISIKSMLGRGGDTWVTEATVISNKIVVRVFLFLKGEHPSPILGK